MAAPNQSILDSIRRDALAARLSISGMVAGEGDHFLRDRLEKAASATSLISAELERLRAVPIESEIDALTVDYYSYLVVKQLEHIAQVSQRRLLYLDRLRMTGKYAAENERCARDDIHWANQWAWTYDPRPDSPLSDLPFQLFPFQEQFFTWLNQRTFLYRQGGLIEKSRDMGISWSLIAWNWHKWRYLPGFSSLLGSRKEDLVDKRGDMGSLFEKLRYQTRFTPEWMLPAGFDPTSKDAMPYMKLVNPENNATIIGESSNDDFGRAGRYTCIFPDEYAAFPSGGRSAYAAMSQSSRCIFPVSTPKGKDNKFAELRFGEYRDRTFSIKWSQHPWKDDRWYRIETSKMNQAEVAQEIDLDYEASLSGRIFTEWDERYHVITWSEFVSKYGAKALHPTGLPRIPHNWMLARGLDWGTTLEHPTAVVWVARPAEDDELSECVFVYRELVRPLPGKEDPVTPLRVARQIVDKQSLSREEGRFSISIMSHEATSEMEAFQLDMPPGYQLSFSKWKPDTTDGIGILQNYMQLNPKKRHPFRPFLDGENHRGSPRLFFIAADGQGSLMPDNFGGYLVEPGIDDAGLARLRAEIPAFHYPKTAAGIERNKPHALFNDAIDSLRKIAANWFPPAAEKTQKRLIEEKLPEHLRLESIQKEEDLQKAGMQYLTRQILMKEKQLEVDAGVHWRDRMYNK